MTSIIFPHFLPGYRTNLTMASLNPATKARIKSPLLSSRPEPGTKVPDINRPAESCCDHFVITFPCYLVQSEDAFAGLFFFFHRRQQ
ncbi:hypothetical protein TNCT_9211 [Trichonephila clavata]|uniref:Uncharacterized protein n=1 Tax=Trichonephila clavata TaxID=2740835 RepID=A0A8X6H0C9_TRICU|nr:hypothetical protein TNCT_9211 [Trichonephila clavata]